MAAVSVILLAVAAGALSRLRRPPTPGAQPAPRADNTPAVVNEANLPGKIRAQQVVSVGSQVGGAIEEFAADVGQEVYEGQVLARIANKGLETAREMAVAALENAQARVNKLESAVIAARLEASRARADASRSRTQFDSAEKAYRRQQTLQREGATPRLAFERSQREFESAQSEYRSLDELARQAEDRVTQVLQELQASKNALDQRRKELEDASAGLAAAEVHSPVSGLIVGRTGEVGKIIGPGEENKDLFQIAVNLSLLDVALEPEPPVLKRIRIHQPALITTADLPAENITGAVKEIRGAEVIVEFLSPSPVLKPGMTAQVRIKLE